MSGIPLELPFLKSIGLAMTFRCPISCAHCIVRAGPQREEEMSLEEAFEWIRQIACYRNGHIKMLSLTGGEPFHDLNRLEKLIILCQITRPDCFCCNQCLLGHGSSNGR